MPEARRETPAAPSAIVLNRVSKSYRLYGSQRQQLLDVLGWSRLWRSRTPVQEFTALREVSLTVPRGRRLGIVGRNGAGKTTLLKLICGNFAPSAGEITVNGSVQALLGMGLGFHQDFTGRENVSASLQYNGLAPSEFRAAVDDIIEFCELGGFIDQPIKTYSLGMQARLMFAAATAVKPEILIVDEVLGAGDAYFVAKSKRRVEALVNNGCTMLLVSHSMQQVLELCEQAIWLDQGAIRMQGEAFLVVKAYEEYMHGPIARMQQSAASASEQQQPDRIVAAAAADNVTAEPAASSVSGDLRETAVARATRVVLQEPRFVPHGEPVELPALADAEAAASRFAFVAPGGVSRWHGDPGLKITGFTIVTERGETNELVCLRPARFVFWVEAEVARRFSVRCGIALHDLMGRCATRIFGPVDRFEAKVGQRRRVEVQLNPNQLGPGEYTLGISVIGETPLEQVNAATRYDLLSRSFSVRVAMPESLGALAADCLHSAEWSMAMQVAQSEAQVVVL